MTLALFYEVGPFFVTLVQFCDEAVNYWEARLFWGRNGKVRLPNSDFDSI